MEIVIGIIGIIIAIIAIYYPRYSKQIKISFLKPTDSKKVDKSIDLYFEKISDEQRIPPDHLIKSLRLPSSATSIRDFKKKIESNLVVHLPLIAEVQDEVVGFLKVIYIKDLKYIFIAYLISKNHNDFDSTRITTALLNKFYRCIKDVKAIDFVTFEIVEETNESHKAKERLFKHIARIKDLKARHIDALYLIPEVCSFDEGNCGIFPSRLFYLDLKGGNSSFITKDYYLSIIDSVYKNIYTESYRVAEPLLVDKHIEFVDLIKTEINQKVNNKINLI
jgi:hypothetical protein